MADQLTCTLGSADFRTRKKEIMDRISPHILRKEALQDGFRYHAALTDETVVLFRRFIELERQCCTLLEFRLSTEGTLRLDITGPEGTKQFLDHELGM